MSPIVAWVVKNERREGDFRYKRMFVSLLVRYSYIGLT